MDTAEFSRLEAAREELRSTDMTERERRAADAQLEAAQRRAMGWPDTVAALVRPDGTVVQAKLVQGQWGPCWRTPSRFLSRSKAKAMGLREVRIVTPAGGPGFFPKPDAEVVG